MQNMPTRFKWWKLFYFLIFFLLMLFLNHLTLYTSDDFAYRFVYEGYLPTDHTVKTTSFLSIIQSQINHWKLWNGRFVAHTLVQLFMQHKKIYFDILNSGAFCFLIYLIIRLAKTSEKLVSLTLISLFLYLWWMLPEMGKSVFWLSGSGNYLWTSLIYLSFILIFRESYKRKKQGFNTLFLPLMGFLAGACNENSSPTTLLICGMYFLIYWIESKKFSWLHFLSLFAGLSGFILMMASPGSRKKDNISFTSDVLKNKFHNVSHLAWDSFKYVYLFLLLGLILALILRKLGKDDVLDIMIFSLAHLVGIFVLILAPYIPQRSLFGPAVFLAIPFIILLVKFYESFDQKLGLILVAVGLCFFAFDYKQVAEDMALSHAEVSEQYAILDQAKSSDVVDLHLLTKTDNLYNAYDGTANVNVNEKDWFNQWMAKYFDVAGVKGYK